MRTFTIVRPLVSEAPDWVNEAWVGVELIQVSALDYGAAYGVRTGKPDAANADGHAADGLMALVALERHSEAGRAAADWYRENCRVTEQQALCFGKQFCELHDELLASA